jgi:hypothetical protein
MKMVQELQKSLSIGMLFALGLQHLLNVSDVDQDFLLLVIASGGQSRHASSNTFGSCGFVV